MRSFLERRLHWIGAAFVFVVTQVVYLRTLNPTVPFWDSGEFITVAKILGIPHPPGTPLYDLIARVAALVFPFPTVAQRVNWLSSLAASLAAVFTYLVAVEIWERGRGSFTSATTPGSSVPEPGTSLEGRLVGVVAGLVAALFTAFSRTFWFNSVEAEMYSTVSFLMALSVWLILRWARYEQDRAMKNGLFILFYYLICLSMGICLMAGLVLPGIILFALLADHKTFGSTPFRAMVVAAIVVLLHPGMLPTLGIAIWMSLVGLVLLLILFWGKKWPMVSGRGLLTWCLIAAILGMSTHFYLTIRALYHHPVINEADPRSWSALWKVLTRDQYKPPNPFLVRKAPWSVQLTKHFWDYARDQYALGLRPMWLGWYLPYLLGVVGAIGNFRREKKSFALMAVNLIVMTLGLVFYLNFQADEVRERDYFFVSAYHFFAVWIGLGAAFTLDWVRQGLGDRPAAEPAGAGTAASAAVSSGTAGMATTAAVSSGTAGTATAAVASSVPAEAAPARRPSRVGPGFPAFVGVGLVLVFLPFMTMKHYWFQRDEHGLYIARDFAYNMLTPLKPNAILFTNGDNDTFPLWYMQEVEHWRKDVTVANLSLLNTDWYIRQLRDYPSSHVDIGWTDAQIESLEPYLDPKTNEPVYVKDMAVRQIVSREYGKRPIYVAVTVPELMGMESRLVMKGLVFELEDSLKGAQSEERIDPDQTLYNLEHVYKYRGLLRPDGTYDNSVYKDDNASRLVQNYSAAYLRAAEEKADQGDEKTSMAAINAAAQIAPNSRAVRYSVGILLLRTGRDAEAEQYFQKLIDQGWGEPRLWRMLGRAQESQKKVQAAEQSYRRAVESDPEDFEAMRDLFSYIWQVVGDRKAAVDVLQQWANRHPDDKRVQEAIKQYSDSINATPHANAPETSSSARFSQWGLTFEYPQDWKESRSDQVTATKENLAQSLTAFGRRLDGYSLILSSTGEAGLIVTKIITPTPMTPTAVVAERRQFYADAANAGEVAHVKAIKDTLINGWPAVLEDVEKSNGGRCRSYKILSGTSIYEVSCIVMDAALWSKYSETMDQIISRLTFDDRGADSKTKARGNTGGPGK